MGHHALFQGIFPTQGSPGLQHCRQILYPLSHRGSPRILERVAYPFSRGSSQPRNRTGVSCIAGGFFTSWDTRELPAGSPFQLFWVVLEGPGQGACPVPRSITEGTQDNRACWQSPLPLQLASLPPELLLLMFPDQCLTSLVTETPSPLLWWCYCWDVTLQRPCDSVPPTEPPCFLQAAHSPPSQH